ncbi:MAG: RNase adapter RapZ [Pseudomonadota bacterium]
MKLIVISGRSGSGKSTALNALEDAGFNCLDNFPLMLLQSLVHNSLRDNAQHNQKLAVCIDARSHDLERFPEILIALDKMEVDCQVIYLDARSPTLVSRFSETRRRHPLTSATVELKQAIEAEAEILEGIADIADLTIDSTTLSSQTLREIISTRVAEKTDRGISLLFRSFGYKYGVPVDADMVFDVRCLPNPYWDPQLRELNGTDQAVIEYLSAEPEVGNMYADLEAYLHKWLPQFEANARVYMTVAIGCTGGQHRSVYLAERLAKHFAANYQNVLIRHREMDKTL